MNDEVIKKLVRRVEALEREKLFRNSERPTPEEVVKELEETSDAVQEARRLDWVSNIGI